MSPADWNLIYPPVVRNELSRMAQILGPVVSPNEAASQPKILGQADILLSGWGGPRLDEQFLDMVPNLKAIFYGGGAMTYMLTDCRF